MRKFILSIIALTMIMSSMTVSAQTIRTRACYDGTNWVGVYTEVPDTWTKAPAGVMSDLYFYMEDGTEVRIEDGIGASTVKRAEIMGGQIYTLENGQQIITYPGKVSLTAINLNTYQAVAIINPNCGDEAIIALANRLYK